MEILALIPARSGSKSVKNKNIRLINGIPMLAYSIMHARKSKYINRIILDTDSEEYAQIGREYGAETPYIRPFEFATDTATDLEVFTHSLKWLKEKENYEPEIIVQLRPTYPIRNVSDIDKMIELLINDKEADSVRSVAPANEIPYKMWKKDENGNLSPLLTEIPEAYNMPRQELPTIYYQNACIDVMRASTILNKNSMTGEKILGYVMENNFDIDTEEDLKKASEEIINQYKNDIVDNKELNNGKLQNTNHILNSVNKAQSVTVQNQDKCDEKELCDTVFCKYRSSDSLLKDHDINFSFEIIETLKLGGKRLVVDIDGVIAKLEKNNDYNKSEPNTEVIKKINELFDFGNEIILFTARGYKTGINWEQVTKKQLESWGVKYHELHFGKPNADYYFDDKMLDISILLS